MHCRPRFHHPSLHAVTSCEVRGADALFPAALSSKKILKSPGSKKVTTSARLRKARMILHAEAARSFDDPFYIMSMRRLRMQYID